MVLLRFACGPFREVWVLGSDVSSGEGLSLLKKSSGGSGFGSWKTVPALPVPVRFPGLPVKEEVLGRMSSKNQGFFLSLPNPLKSLEKKGKTLKRMRNSTQGETNKEFPHNKERKESVGWTPICRESFGQGLESPEKKNKDLGEDIYDPRARTSTRSHVAFTKKLGSEKLDPEVLQSRIWVEFFIIFGPGEF